MFSATIGAKVRRRGPPLADVVAARERHRGRRVQAIGGAPREDLERHVLAPGPAAGNRRAVVLAASAAIASTVASRSASKFASGTGRRAPCGLPALLRPAPTHRVARPAPRESGVYRRSMPLTASKIAAWTMASRRGPAKTPAIPAVAIARRVAAFHLSTASSWAATGEAASSAPNRTLAAVRNPVVPADRLAFPNAEGRNVMSSSHTRFR